MGLSYFRERWKEAIAKVDGWWDFIADHGFGSPAEFYVWSTLQQAHLFSWSNVPLKTLGKHFWTAMRSHLLELVNQTPTTIRKTRASALHHDGWRNRPLRINPPTTLQGHIIGHIHPNRQASLHLQSTLKIRAEERRRQYMIEPFTFQKCQELMFACLSRQQDDCRVVYISVYTYFRKRGRLHPSIVITLTSGKGPS
jgi:hypothetical protein